LGEAWRVLLAMKSMRLCLVAALLLTGLTLPAWSQDSTIQNRTRTFLDAYAKGDREAIAKLIDPVNITMYGSDKAEIVHGSDAVFKLLSEDQQLWGGAVHFGAMEQISLIQNHSLASIVFNVPFVMGDRPPMPIRVVALWKREGRKWLLIQSSNTALTEHQSASELLRHP
jgi:hypothetical protein